MTEHFPEISAVIPTYCNGGSLAGLAERLKASLAGTGRSFEIIFVNDGSPDSSWEAIRAICSAQKEVRGINLMRNYGQQNALLAGIMKAKGKIIVTLDDDFQNPPEEIPKLLAKIDEGYDLVYGTRQRERHGWARNMASRISKKLVQWTMKAPTAGSITSFRAFRAEIVQHGVQENPAAVFIDALLYWGTQKIASVPVLHDARLVGRSNYSWAKLVSHGFDMVTGLSSGPLHLASWLGFLVTSLGSILLAFVLGSYFFQTQRVPGFTFLAAVIIVFSGVQLFVLGVIGEYLARAYLRVLGKPAFLIKEVL